MIEQNREPLKAGEAARLDRIENRSLLRRVFRKPNDGSESGQQLVDTYRVSVEKCFIPVDFNEELPLYLLDLGGTLLILFGQWLFDPHTSIVPTDIFERWVCGENFFTRFSLRCSGKYGVVFEFRVEDSSFIRVEQLSCPLRFRRLREYQLLAGHGETLIRDLQNANLIEAEKS
jgi:hypothetical protein